MTKGAGYSYADYGLGTYITFRYTVQFGNVSATAYCIQPSAPSPGSGTYTIIRLKDGKALAKVCYYGTKASGKNGFFAEKHPDFPEGKKFIIVHMAASYANGSGDAFSGANATAQSLAMELYKMCIRDRSRSWSTPAEETCRPMPLRLNSTGIPISALIMAIS